MPILLDKRSKHIPQFFDCTFHRNTRLSKLRPTCNLSRPPRIFDVYDFGVGISKPKLTRIQPHKKFRKVHKDYNSFWLYVYTPTVFRPGLFIIKVFYIFLILSSEGLSPSILNFVCSVFKVPGVNVCEEASESLKRRSDSSPVVTGEVDPRGRAR